MYSRDSMHKNVHCEAHRHLLVMGLKQEESRRVALSSGLFGVLEMKDDVDTSKKNKYKMAKIACTGMWHQMHFLDLKQLDCWPH